MPERAYTFCKEPGCLNRTRTRYCEVHVKNNQAGRLRYAADRKRKKDAVWKLYNCAQWHRCRDSFLSVNPICQRIVDGVQCREAATLVHHLISPRVRNDFMYSFNNLKALCENHHSGEEGSPAEELANLDQFYTATKFPAWMGKK
jgi:5-methylcytosine-specific restriction protein A